MTLKNIIKMASDKSILVRMQTIEYNERNKPNMTEYEQKRADQLNRKLAREIIKILENK